MPWSEPQVLEGYFIFGRERQQFLPGRDCHRLSGDRWWFHDRDDRQSTALFNVWTMLQREAPPPPSASRESVIRVRLVARLSPEGEWGHLGQYKRAVAMVLRQDLWLVPECHLIRSTDGGISWPDPQPTVYHAHLLPGPGLAGYFAIDVTREVQTDAGLTSTRLYRLPMHESAIEHRADAWRDDARDSSR